MRYICSKKEQVTLTVEIFGVERPLTMSVEEWATFIGIKFSRINTRRSRGMNWQESLDPQKRTVTFNSMHYVPCSTRITKKQKGNQQLSLF